MKFEPLVIEQNQNIYYTFSNLLYNYFFFILDNYMHMLIRYKISGLEYEMLIILFIQIHFEIVIQLD